MHFFLLIFDTLKYPLLERIINGKPVVGERRWFLIKNKKKPSVGGCKLKKNCGIVQGLWFLGIFAQKTHLCSDVTGGGGGGETNRRAAERVLEPVRRTRARHSRRRTHHNSSLQTDTTVVAKAHTPSDVSSR